PRRRAGRLPGHRPGSARTSMPSRWRAAGACGYPSGHPPLEEVAEHRIDVGGRDQLLLGETLREKLAHHLVFVPERLVLARGDLHVGEVLDEEIGRASWREGEGRQVER